MPTMNDIRNPYIFPAGIRHIINVSEHKYPEDVRKAIEDKGIKCYHFPISEADGASWDASIKEALTILRAIHDMKEGVIVHCTCGNNRSRSVVEAFHLDLTGEHIDDEYKGYSNHYLYNVSIGHITP